MTSGLGPRLFATAKDEPRARRATDLVVLAASGLGLVALGAAASPPAGLSRSLTTFLQSLPRFLDGFWQVLADLLLVAALLVVAAAVLRGRLALARDLVLAPVAALALALVATRLVDGAWPEVWDPLRSVAPPPLTLPLRIALPAAVVLVAVPHLARPARRLLRRLTSLAAIAVVVLGATDVTGAGAGLLVATAAAALVHLVFGSSGGRPALEGVAAALAELGVDARNPTIADREQAGVFLVDAEDADGRALQVKVYGRDARDSALVATLWRTVWLREPGSPTSPGRLQQVEHEAFLTLLAGQADIRTDTVVTAGATGEDDALLVLRPTGVALGDLSPGERPADLLAQVWALVARLHEAGITHGQLDAEHLLVDDGVVGIADFRGATVAPATGQRRTDEAQALVTTLFLAGEDEALAAAIEAVGPEELAAVLPFLQFAALTPRQRQAVKADGIDLDAWRAAAAEAAGVEAPALQQLRRITVGSVARVLLPGIAVVALVSGISGLDAEAFVDALGDATWWLVAVGFVAAQLPRLSQSVSTLGAAPAPLPLGPVYALQLAVSYVNLAIPTAAARIAVNIRFFQRHGVPPGAALSAGALDGFAGLVVQAALLASLLLFTPASLDLDLSGTASGVGGHLLVLVGVLLAVVAVAVLGVARWRRLILEWGRHVGSEALSTLKGLRSPRRLLLLFGGNLGSEVLFASALGVFTLAMGYPLGLDELIFINVAVALLAGLIPVPGGIGVAEGGLVYGLVTAGMPEESAFAAVILYRLSTFYLPPIWGFFALRWLERNQHL